MRPTIKPNKKFEDIRHIFEIHMKDMDMKITPTRVALAQILSTSPSPLSINEIVSQLRNVADRATIYRNLRDFERSRTIRKVDFAHDHAHYEWSLQGHRHYAICTSCGSTSQIPCSFSLDNLESNKNHLRSITGHSLELYGLCDKCA